MAFIAVPAEEYGDVEWRVNQRNEGKLEFLGGKPEMLRLGHLDDVDMAMMIHATPRTEEGKLAVPISNNGCMVKTVRYIGKAAHAGGMPHAASTRSTPPTSASPRSTRIRETFRDEDTIRVHPIITHGGSQVNVIPAEVRLETYVRGKSVEAIAEADAKVDRALRAGALALGATGRDRDAARLHADALRRRRWSSASGRSRRSSSGAENVGTISHRTGSTDMGDLAQVMPIIHPYVGGASGTSHGADFEISDPNLLYITNAKALASMAVDLLADGAASAVRSWRRPSRR